MEASKISVRVAHRWASSPDVAYHVTYLRNLDDIAENGIVPGGGEAGGAKFLYHSRGRSFFSDKAGLPHWFDLMSNRAADMSDNAYESGHVPVVLRFPSPMQAQEDEMGAHESGAGAWFTEEPIDPDEIEIWNGSSWVPIDEWDTIDASGSFDFEEDDGEELAWMKFYSENPLYPA